MTGLHPDSQGSDFEVCESKELPLASARMEPGRRWAPGGCHSKGHPGLCLGLCSGMERAEPRTFSLLIHGLSAHIPDRGARCVSTFWATMSSSPKWDGLCALHPWPAPPP